MQRMFTPQWLKCAGLKTTCIKPTTGGYTGQSWCSMWRRPLLRVRTNPLFARADVLCFNKGGFEKYVGKRDAEACIQNLLNRGCIVSVTLGADGCQCWDARSHVRLPGWRVNAIDTTGAGDTFNASLVCGLLQGKTLKAAAQFANAAAARATTVLGPRGGAVSMDTVEAFINHCQKGMEQHGCL